MTTNTSATGGTLLPNPAPAPQPVEDSALDAFLQTLFAGLTGLAGNYVRPRWQTVAPQMPDPSTPWMSVGVAHFDQDTNSYVEHVPVAAPGTSYDVEQFHEELDVLCSFYGPTAGLLSKLVRAGLDIPQNREQLQLAGWGYVECGGRQVLPEQVNNQWVRRIDMKVVFRRAVVLTYPVLDIVSVPVTVVTGGNGSATTSNVTVS